MRLTVGMLLAAVVAAALAFLANWTAREYPAPPGPAPQSDRRTVQAPDRARNAGTEPVQVLDRLPANIRDVTPAHVLPAPKIVEDVIVRIPAATAPVPPPRPRPHHWSRAIVVSGGVLKSGDTQIVIAGIAALGSDAACEHGAAGPWPCGNFARADLQRLIRQRTIECDPASAPGGEAGAGTITTRCRVSGRDIGDWLVRQGWASPLPGSGYEEALAEARKSGLGQWREAGSN